MRYLLSLTCVIYISYCVVYSQVVFSLRLYYLIKSCCTKFGAWITVSFIHRSSVVAAPLAIEMAYFCWFNGWFVNINMKRNWYLFILIFESVPSPFFQKKKNFVCIHIFSMKGGIKSCVLLPSVLTICLCFIVRQE